MISTLSHTNSQRLENEEANLDKMSYEIIEQSSKPCFTFPSFPPFQFETITDLLKIHRVTPKPKPEPDSYIQLLNDRFSALELGFDRMFKEEENKKENKKKVVDEIKSPEYTWISKWMAEIKGNDVHEEEKKKKKKKSVKESKGKVKNDANHGGIILRQIFANRVKKSKRKWSQLAPQDAAALIQMTFRAYLTRRSQALRALMELAIAKTKLKELRSLLNNFSYRRRISSDAEERQRFTEKIIVLLLTVDTIEGTDLMVRSAKKSMVDELEGMLDVVDPQPTRECLPMRRRTFDMPDGVLNNEQTFAKRVEKRKRKQLAPQDAAALIQMTFRAYLTRRSQALRALRELAIAKTKLKELRSLLNNFSYRRRISSDAEERQRFTEKIIVLLLTVDTIEGTDLMVRSAKKSMVDELEGMLDVVDPQPTRECLPMRRRTFDMPDGVLNNEQTFAKRVEKRKRKQLAPQDAAALIQMTFRAYLTRRSQALRALRELAIAKTKLKELRSLLNNFSYRRRISSDAEERQRFTEKIIVLLLTVDTIEGTDLMVRSAKKSMVDELEAMLDVVDPQPTRECLPMRRRTFDMPDGVLNNEQTFAKRVEKRKRKQLAPQDAAALIQMTFRAYLTRRSQALRALRELAIAKTKLKELRSLLNNFSYRRRISSDAEERQRFTEKIIVLLLTVDTIEGTDLMVRSAKKSMVEELEAMLDMVDTQPTRECLPMRRRTFDMPDGVFNNEQTFAKRVEKRKRKQLAPQDAAALIQMTFRAYLTRRSQALRALRELAIAKTKLKERRSLLNNFSYRRRISSDAEERQRFTEKIIVLLLTVDTIEGTDLMVRSAKKSMVDELEAMLDVVDPQPTRECLPMRRRTFDMPDGVLNNEQNFAMRVEKKKRKQLAPQDAAALIQMTFRAYLIRRSQALHALMELAIAKTKLKELRFLFNNFSYRRRISSDAEERQRFTEKIIVLLLTGDAIEGADVMVRSAKKSMVDELEAMLDVVDTQPTGKMPTQRRAFDMPDEVMRKELSDGVAQVVRLLNEEEEASETFED